MLRGWNQPLYAADSGADAASSAETKNTDPAQQEHMIPKSRFDEVNTALAELKAWKAEREKEAAAAEAARKSQEEAEAAQRGEFEKLANERAAKLKEIEAQHASTAERIKAYEEAMEAQYKQRLKALPEAIRDLAPSGDTLTRYNWLATAETAAAKLAKPEVRGTPSGPRGTGTSSNASTSSDDLKQQKRSTIGGL